MSAKVFIVDDYREMRESLRKLLELEADFEVCGEAGTVQEALERIPEAHPQIVVSDLRLGPKSGLELVAPLDRMEPPVPVLLLSMYPETQYAEIALQNGASGYVMKSESPDQILAALRSTLSGHRYVSPAMETRLKRKGDSV